MSLHYHLMKINEDDVERVRAMRIGRGLPRGVLVETGPSPRAHRIVACPIDSEAAELVRREVPAVMLSLEGLYRIRL